MCGILGVQHLRCLEDHCHSLGNVWGVLSKEAGVEKWVWELLCALLVIKAPAVSEMVQGGLVEFKSECRLERPADLGILSLGGRTEREAIGVDSEAELC